VDKGNNKDASKPKVILNSFQNKKRDELKSEEQSINLNFMQVQIIVGTSQLFQLVLLFANTRILKFDLE
jgi:hypothetical protein